MRPSQLDHLVRLSLGLPDPGLEISDDPIMLAGIRAGLRLDSYCAAEDLRVAEVARRIEQERKQAREQPRPEQGVEIDKAKPTRSLS